MTSLTIFTWGYDGWGSSTRQLKDAVDTVEQGRGFEPPYFVDLRISRSVRAEGFRENAFEKVLGRDRYQWMPSLGNKAIRRRTGPRIQINEPAAVEELLGIALRRNAKRQRLLMFCQCPLPGRPGGHDQCHRVKVASLLLKAAAKRNVSLTIAEWPGGQPQSRALKTDDLQLKKSKWRKNTFHLGSGSPRLNSWRCPGPHWSTLCLPSSSVRAIADPAVYRGGKWLLPITSVVADQRIGRGLSQGVPPAASSVWSRSPQIIVTACASADYPALCPTQC